MKNKPTRRLAALAILAISTFNPRLSTSHAQGTAFTYQGRLNDGANPASGIYDLRFGIYDALAAGAQQGNLLTNSATVVSNGLFTVTLDFGNQFPGANRWLEIAVRTNGAANFYPLSPRQALTPAPYAVFSATATTATTASSASSVAATNITGTMQLAQLPAAVVTNNQSGVILSGTFSGNGAQLTDLNLNNDVLFSSSASPSTNLFLVLSEATNTPWFNGTNYFSPALSTNGMSVWTNYVAGHGTVYITSNFVQTAAWTTSGVNVSGWTISTTFPPDASLYNLPYINLYQNYNWSGPVWFDENNPQDTSLRMLVPTPATLLNGLIVSAPAKLGSTLNVSGDITVSNVYATGNLLLDNSATALGLVSGTGGIYLPAGLGGRIFFDANGTIPCAIWYNTNHGPFSTLSGKISNLQMGGNGRTSILAGYDNHADGAIQIGTPNATHEIIEIPTDGGGATDISPWAFGTTNWPSKTILFGCGYKSSGTVYGINIGMKAECLDTNGNAVFRIYNPAYGANIVTLGNNAGLNPAGFGTNIGTISVEIGTNSFNVAGVINGNGAGLTNLNASHLSSGVISDSLLSANVAFLSANQTFLGRNIFNSNVGIGNPSPTNRLMVVNARCDGSSWINASDRNLKQDFATVDTQAVLAQVATLPVTTWRYKAQPDQKHLGPVAQDFHAAFGLGQDDTSISTVDEAGVALAAIQGLNQKVDQLKTELNRREAENAELRVRLKKLEDLSAKQNDRR